MIGHYIFTLFFNTYGICAILLCNYNVSPPLLWYICLTVLTSLKKKKKKKEAFILTSLDNF